MKPFHRCTRICILCLLVVSVFIPICILSQRLKHLHSDASKGFVVEDLSVIKHRTEAQTLSAIEEDESEGVKEPTLVVYKDEELKTGVRLSSFNENNSSSGSGSSIGNIDLLERNGTNDKVRENYHQVSEEKSPPSGGKEQSKPPRIQHDQNVQPRSRRVIDEKVKEMKDQVIRAKAYLNFAPPSSNTHFVKELKLRIKELERAIGESTKDSDLSRRALQKMKAMEITLSKASRLFPDCSAMVKKLRAMTYNAEEQVRTQKNQTTFLIHLAGRTTPKGMHCLSMKLTTEYFNLQTKEREFPNQYRLDDPHLFHFAVFLTMFWLAQWLSIQLFQLLGNREKIVFHIVTDSLNFPAMSMWFLLNPPGKATVQVQSVDNFEWLSSKYDVVLQKQDSLDPRYTSPLNHLRFYLPDVFPSLNKVVLLDHDVVVQRDLAVLWSIDMKGKVNGAVETCQEGDPSFRRMDMYINFTDSMVAKRFDVNACTWAFGMNLFDLQEWRRRNLTLVYHKYLRLGNKRPLFKAGSLPIGWMTFYKHTLPLEKRWHILGLGYDSGVRLNDIEQGAVIHFDGIMKPWLDVGLEKYKQLWRRHVMYDHPILQQCNIHG